MTRWTCERCGREFGRVNQSHMCAPALSIDSYFDGKQQFHAEIFRAVLAALEQIGPVHTEAVRVGIMFKKQRTFAELRPRTKYTILSLLFSRVIEHPRLTSVFHLSGNRVAQSVRLTSAVEVDDEVRAWLAEAYESSPESQS